MSHKGQDSIEERERESILSLKLRENTHSEGAGQKEMMYIVYIPFTQNTTTRALEPSSLKLIPS